MFSLAPGTGTNQSGTAGSYKWGTSVALNFSTTALEPATYSSSKLVKKDGTTEAASGTNYVQAQFFVRCSPSATINFGECSVTSSNVNAYSMLATVTDGATIPHTYAQGAKVKAAAGNALRMVAATEAKTDAKENVWTTTDAAISTLGTTVYSLGEDKATTTGDVAITNFENSMTSSAFANRYYDAVAGNTQGTTKPNTDDKDPYTVNEIETKSTNLFTAEALPENSTDNYKVYTVCLTLLI